MKTADKPLQYMGGQKHENADRPLQDTTYMLCAQESDRHEADKPLVGDYIKKRMNRCDKKKTKQSG
jgi:hypothetical protein